MKHSIAIVGMLLTLGVAAQEGPKISSAVIEFDRNRDTVLAKKYINEAADIINSKTPAMVKPKVLAKFYYYQGAINFAISQSNKPSTKALEPNGLDLSAEGFQKLIEFEKASGRQQYTPQAQQMMPAIARAYANRGIEASSTKNYEEAYNDFMLTYNFKKENNLGTDTAMLYNAALMAQNAEDYDNAIKQTKALLDMNYKGQTYKATNSANGETVEFANKTQLTSAIEKTNGLYVDPVIAGDVRPDLYIAMASMYKKTGDTINYDATVSAGRAVFPDNKSMLLLELQKYLDTKQYDKAMVNLNQAMEADPTNYLYPYLIGYIYQTDLKDYTKANEYYDKAIAINPDKIEPQYMKGLIYVDQANTITEKMNKLKLNETTKYNQYQKEQKEMFEKALPFFERAREIDPKDVDTMKALKEVYYKLKMYEKAQELQKEIDAVTK